MRKQEKKTIISCRGTKGGAFLGSIGALGEGGTFLVMRGDEKKCSRGGKWRRRKGELSVNLMGRKDVQMERTGADHGKG